MNGFDISKHNGSIDFNKVKAEGYDFVIIRAGYGKSTKDSRFDENIRKALNAGLKVGVYWFIYAKTSNDILGNVKMANAVLNNWKDTITMGVWADYEYDSDKYVGRQLSVQERTAWVKAFIEGMKGNGYECGLYANPDYLDNKFGNLKAYKLWIARYTEDESKVTGYKPYMWQYSSTGNINGIKGNVDLNKIIDSQEKPIDTKPKCYGIVTTKGSNLMLRKEPNSKSAILEKIPNGAEIEIVKFNNNGWYLVKFNGTKGYAFAKYISEVI